MWNSTYRKGHFYHYPNVDILLTDECVMSVTNHYVRKNNKLGTTFTVILILHISLFSPNLNKIITCAGPPRLARPPRPGPCLDFGLQYTLIRNNWSKQIGVEYWALPGSNSPWRPWKWWRKLMTKPMIWLS